MKLLKALVLALLFIACTPMQEGVKYPSEEQPGIALATTDGGSYTLSNKLISASYSIEGGVLSFNGCESLQLAPSKDLFSITLGDSTVVKSSEMKMMQNRS